MAKNRRTKWFLGVCLVWAGCLLASCSVQEVDTGSLKERRDYLRASEEDVQNWREMKFGLFVHWGPVSLMGTEIGWSRGGKRPGRKGTGPIHVEVYDNLYRSFYPAKFDAKEWVQLAQEAGMKYVVFTTKHHDGFCMFDSALTDYKITNSPFKRDVVRELADACHRGGLKLGFYYSPPDWHHPDYRTENHARYIKYLHGQLRELCTNYGRVDIIFFDGLGGKAEDWGSENLFRMVRRLQPHVVINDRAGLPGDYQTPENRVGFFQTSRAWETCATLGKQWAWKTNDKLRSLKECIHMLVTCATGDGNFLLNVGPMPTGEIEPRQAKLLRQIGIWLKHYGESIYGTRGGPFVAPDEKSRRREDYYGKFSIAGDRWWGGSTHKDNVIYLHILRWPSDVIKLAPIKRKIVSYRVLTGGTATVKQTEKGIEISVPQAHRKELDTIIALKLDGPAANVK